MDEIRNIVMVRPRHSGRFLGLVALGRVLCGLNPVAQAETVPQNSPTDARPLEVVAVGRRTPLVHSERAPTTASSVIQGEALRAAGTSSGDLLARVPGVQVARSGSQSDLATASIRGADSKQVPVYLAGIRLNDDLSGTADLSTVPLWMIERVEVFRGNAPVQADRLGLGGAIFFTPRMPRKTRVGSGLELGSFGERGGSLAYEVGGKKSAALVAVRHLEAENAYLYENDRGQRFDRDSIEIRRPNADFVEHDAWAIGRVRTGRGATITSVFNAFQREQGLSGLSVIPALYSRAQTQRFLGGISARTPCAPDLERCTLTLDTSALLGKTTIRDPFFEIASLGTVLQQSEGQRVSQRGSVAWRPSSSFEVEGSVQPSFESLRIDRASSAPRRAQRSSAEAALTTNWSLSRRLSFNDLFGLECQATHATFSEFGRDTTREVGGCDPSLRGGALLALSDDLELLANVGRYVRTPTLTELYGSSAVVSGNPSLTAEKGISADLGARGTRFGVGPLDPTLSVDALVFARFAADMIRYQRASRDSVAPFNVGAARILGAELALGFDWLDHLRGEVATTLLDPRETTGDARIDPTRNDLLPLTSRFVAVSHLEFYAEPGRPGLDTFSIGARHLHRSSRYEDPAGQTVLPAQNFLDLEAAASFLDGVFEAHLALRDVFDSRQYDLLGMPLPGRSVHLRGEAWF